MRAVSPLSKPEREDFIAAARACMGVRFRHQGRDPRFGLDCAGLALWALRQVGREPVDIDGYGREPHKNGLEQAIVANLGDAIPLDQMQPGDVVLMRFGPDPRHVGILTDHPGGLALLHVHDRAKVVTEHRLDKRYTIVKAWRP